MMGELVRHEADVVVAGLTISLDRERAVEFSMPFMNLGISLMILKPKENVNVFFLFLNRNFKLYYKENKFFQIVNRNLVYLVSRSHCQVKFGCAFFLVT
jgi:hypothetical protein